MCIMLCNRNSNEFVFAGKSALMYTYYAIFNSFTLLLLLLQVVVVKPAVWEE